MERMRDGWHDFTRKLDMKYGCNTVSIIFWVCLITHFVTGIIIIILASIAAATFGSRAFTAGILAGVGNFLVAMVGVLCRLRADSPPHPLRLTFALLSIIGLILNVAVVMVTWSDHREVSNGSFSDFGIVICVLAILEASNCIICVCVVIDVGSGEIQCGTRHVFPVQEPTEKPVTVTTIQVKEKPQKFPSQLSVTSQTSPRNNKDTISKERMYEDIIYEIAHQPGSLRDVNVDRPGQISF